MLAENLLKFQRILNKQPFSQIKAHPALSLGSLKKNTSCSYCQIMEGVCNDLQTKIQSMVEQYNQLLCLSKIVSNSIYETLQTHEFEEQQLRKEIEQYKLEIDQLQKQYKEALNNKQETIFQYQEAIMQKQFIIEELQQHFERIENKENLIQIQNKQLRGTCQLLSNHKRDKSKLFSKLETEKLNILQEKIKLTQQNQALKSRISELTKQIENLQANLLFNNITTPRVIENTYRKSQDSLKQSNSLGEQSVIEHQSRLQKDFFVDMPNNCADPCQSFMDNRGIALRDILNISGETNKYFKFTRTKQKIFDTNSSKGFLGESAKNIRSVQQIGYRTSKQDFSQQRQKHHTQGSQKIDHKIQKNVNQFNIKESIQQFQQQKPMNLHLNKHAHLASTEQNIPNINIDPYYAFFTLTIQCIKLNWKNMDEVTNIDLSGEWSTLLGKNVQMNHWQKYLQKKMKEQVKKQKSKSIKK